MQTELVRGIYNIKPRHRGTVATIGNFDGVHKGHLALLAKLIETARKLQLPATVIIFEPQPIEFFQPQKPIARLMRLREKFFALAAAGVDRVLVLHFNEKLAAITPENFVKEILVEHLNVKHVIVGDDFRFGHKRAGDFNFLQNAGKTAGFTVEAMPTFLFNDVRVSSTRVREALMNFDFEKIMQLLGRPYSMMGRIVHGNKRGRMIGFPTANIYLHRAMSAVQGVFVVKMKIANAVFAGVANVGIRPTVDGTRTLLEVHLFNFAEDIYGKQVEVEFLKKIRDEKRFDNVDILKAQIWKDAEVAREYHGL